MLCFEILKKVAQANGKPNYVHQHRTNDMFLISVEVDDKFLAKEILLEFEEWGINSTFGMVSAPAFIIPLANPEMDKVAITGHTTYLSFSDLRDFLMFKLKFNDFVGSAGTFVVNEDSLTNDTCMPVKSISDIRRYRPDAKIPDGISIG